MANRLSKEKACLIASNYMTNGLKKVEALLSAGYSNHYARHGGLRLFDNVTVKEAISRIEANNQAGTEFTLQKYQDQLQDDRQFAINLKQPSAAVTASVAMGRSCGFDKDMQASPDQPLPMTKEQLAEANRVANVALANNTTAQEAS